MQEGCGQWTEESRKDACMQFLQYDGGSMQQQAEVFIDPSQERSAVCAWVLGVARLRMTRNCHDLVHFFV